LASRQGLLPLPSPFLMGLLDQPIVLHTRNRLEILGIRCFPWTVFDLLGLPPGPDPVQVFEHPIAPLHSPLETYIQGGNIEAALALPRLQPRPSGAGAGLYRSGPPEPGVQALQRHHSRRLRSKSQITFP